MGSVLTFDTGDARTGVGLLLRYFTKSFATRCHVTFVAPISYRLVNNHLTRFCLASSFHTNRYKIITKKERTNEMTTAHVNLEQKNGVATMAVSHKSNHQRGFLCGSCNS
jgi:hypothetical protein